jgi:hypothetical protein
MQPGDSLLAERELSLKDLGVLKLEYKLLKPSSVDALAIRAAIAVIIRSSLVTKKLK